MLTLKITDANRSKIRLLRVTTASLSVLLLLFYCIVFRVQKYTGYEYMAFATSRGFLECLITKNQFYLGIRRDLDSKPATLGWSHKHGSWFSDVDEFDGTPNPKSIWHFSIPGVHAEVIPLNSPQLNRNQIANNYVAILSNSFVLAAIGMTLLFCVRCLAILNKRNRGHEGKCRNCGYDLRGSVHQCPECGTTFVKLPENQAPKSGCKRKD